MTFTDKATAKSEVEFLRHKSETRKAYRDFAARIKTQHGISIKELHSDGGSEYNSDQLKEDLTLHTDIHFMALKIH